jgi:hypothetical protein
MLFSAKIHVSHTDPELIPILSEEIRDKVATLYKLVEEKKQRIFSS